MVTLVLNDLEFILQQIKIAEANSTAHSGTSAVPLSQLIIDPHLPYGLRTVDGTYNNTIDGRQFYGSADQPMPQILQPVERMGTGSITFGPGMTITGGSYTDLVTLADLEPRLISNLIADQTLGNPAAVIAALENAGVAATVGVVNAITTAFNAAVSTRAAADAGGGVAAAVAAQDALIAQLTEHGIGIDGFKTVDGELSLDDRGLLLTPPGPAVAHHPEHRARRGPDCPVQLVDDAVRPVLRPRSRPDSEGRRGHGVHPADA